MGKLYFLFLFFPFWGDMAGEVAKWKQLPNCGQKHDTGLVKFCNGFC